MALLYCIRKHGFSSRGVKKEKSWQCEQTTGPYLTLATKRWGFSENQNVSNSSKDPCNNNVIAWKGSRPFLIVLRGRTARPEGWKNNHQDQDERSVWWVQPLLISTEINPGLKPNYRLSAEIRVFRYIYPRSNKVGYVQYRKSFLKSHWTVFRMIHCQLGEGCTVCTVGNYAIRKGKTKFTVQLNFQKLFNWFSLLINPWKMLMHYH